MNDKRILVVDDDLNIQQMLKLCLESSGYAVDQATDGAGALETIAQNPPAAILLDLAMPVLDGMSVLADLRSLLSIQATKVIVMTAHGSVKSAIQAIRLGACDFLEKPFKPEDIRQSLQSVLNDSSPDSSHESSEYERTLESVRDALRRGKFLTAEAALMKAGTISDCDPCFLNLAGVLHEAHGRRTSAGNFYRKSMAVDAGYLPAQRNFRRLEQMEQLGSSRLEIDLGDADVSEPVNASEVASSAERFRRVLHSRGTMQHARPGYF